MNNQDQQQARDIARWFASKKTFDATEISATALALLNRVGQVRFKNLVMTEVEAIRNGLSRHYPGRNFIAKGIHPVKQKFINALYTKLVRERVMPEIYKFVNQAVEVGAFMTTLLVAEDVPGINRVVTSDQTVASEQHYKDLINGVNQEVDVLNRIIGALDNNNLDQLDLADGDDEDDVPGDESSSSGDGPDEVEQVPRNLRRAVAEASPESLGSLSPSPPPAPRRAVKPAQRRGRLVRRQLDLDDEEEADIDVANDSDEPVFKRRKN